MTKLDKQIIQLEMDYGYIPTRDENEFKNINDYKLFVENEATKYIKDMQDRNLLTETILTEGINYEFS